MKITELPSNMAIKKNIIEVVAENNISLKGLVLSGSGTMFTFGAYHLSYETIFLALAGFMVSVMSFYYDFTHSVDEKTKGQLASEAMRHLIFGTFAFPAVYAQLERAYDFPVEMEIFISIVISYSVMIFIPFAIELLKNFIKGFSK